MDEKEKEPERRPEIGFTLRMIHNQIKSVIHKTFPVNEEKRPQSQLQGGILGYLYHSLDFEKKQKKTRCIFTCFLNH